MPVLMPSYRVSEWTLKFSEMVWKVSGFYIVSGWLVGVRTLEDTQDVGCFNVGLKLTEFPRQATVVQCITYQGVGGGTAVRPQALTHSILWNLSHIIFSFSMVVQL